MRAIHTISASFINRSLKAFSWPCVDQCISAGVRERAGAAVLALLEDAVEEAVGESSPKNQVPSSGIAFASATGGFKSSSTGAEPPSFSAFASTLEDSLLFGRADLLFPTSTHRDLIAGCFRVMCNYYASHVFIC